MRSSTATPEVILESFASLLSFAETNGTTHPLLNSKKPTLSRFISSSVKSKQGSNVTKNRFSFSSLSLNKNVVHKNQTNRSMNRQDLVALSMSIPRFVNCDQVEKIPRKMLSRVSESFYQLISSRLRCCLVPLLRKAFRNGCNFEAKLLLKLLTSRKPIKLTTIVTSFRVVSSKDKQAQNQKNNNLVSPIIFEAVIDFKVMEKMVTVSLKAPGTISGRFDLSDGLLTEVEICLNTIELLNCMMEQARLVVKKALRVATTVTAALSNKAAKKKLTGQTSTQNFTNLCSSSNNLLTHYPANVRDTVERFQPMQLNESSESTTSIPGENNSEDNESKKPLFHEFFSWIKDDEMILKEEPPTMDMKTISDEYNQPMPTPLSSLGWQAFTELAAAQAVVSENHETKVTQD